jgi:ribonuclease HI
MSISNVSDKKMEKITTKQEIEKKVRGAVVYTDGSASPNPGFMGWGAHGYIYEVTGKAEPIEILDNLITDKGYINVNEESGEISKAVKPVQFLDYFGSSDEIGTNNLAEVNAVFHTLSSLENLDVKTIILHTDSEYTRRGINEWSKQWIARGWKRQDGQDVSNKESWIRLLNKVDDLINAGITLDIRWIKGHDKFLGNVLADNLADVGQTNSSKGIYTSFFDHKDSVDYFSKKINKHPFLNYTRLAFNSIPEKNTEGVYYLLKPGVDDSQIAKKDNEASYAIVILKEPDMVIEAIKNKQYEVSNGVDSVILLRLDTIYNKGIYNWLKTSVNTCLYNKSSFNTGLSFINDEVVSIELNPAGLSLRAIETFSELEYILNEFKLCREMSENTTNLNIEDITNIFYENNTKVVKNKETITTNLKTEYGNGFKKTFIDLIVENGKDIKSMSIPILLGLDLPDRNSLKRIETLNPKIFLLSWKKSETSYSYCVVVETNDATSVWSNASSTQVFLLK